jgi:hypothetical protein
VAPYTGVDVRDSTRNEEDTDLVFKISASTAMIITLNNTVLEMLRAKLANWRVEHETTKGYRR